MKFVVTFLLKYFINIPLYPRQAQLLRSERKLCRFELNIQCLALHPARARFLMTLTACKLGPPVFLKVQFVAQKKMLIIFYIFLNSHYIIFFSYQNTINSESQGQIFTMPITLFLVLT